MGQHSTTPVLFPLQLHDTHELHDINDYHTLLDAHAHAVRACMSSVMSMSACRVS